MAEHVVVSDVSRHVPVRTGRGQNDRETWRARARRVSKEKSATILAMGAPVRLRPGQVAIVELTRVSRGELDDDNCVSALKAIRDGVACWLGVDDGSRRVRFTYGQRKQSTNIGVDVRVTVAERAPRGHA